MDARVVFLCLLLVCLPLAGCVSNPDVIGEASASDEAVPQTSSQGSTASSNNLPPVISASLVSDSSYFEGSDCTTAGIEFRGRHAMMDWNDNITQSGWDLNLDGQIDVPVSTSEGYTTMRLNFSDMVTHTQLSDGSNNLEYTYAEASVVFGAQDESGEWSSSSLLLLRKLTSYTSTNQYNGQSSTYSYLDEEPCADFDDVRDYNFSLSDHADFASDGSTDYLVTISRTNGANGINWNRVRIYFDGSDEGNELCTATSRCQLLSGDGLQNTTSLGSMWEVGQSITIKEDGNNFHRAGYTAGVTIYIDNVLVFDEDIMLN
jgi:hypothetical protein